MGLEVYYPQDILNALQAAEQATAAAVAANGNPDDAYSQGYVNGYRAALTTVLLAFGLSPRPSHELLCWREMEIERRVRW